MKWLNTVSSACLAGLIATAAGAEVVATYRQFRVIEEGGKVTKTEPILSIQTPLWAKNVSQTPYAWPKPEAAAKPYFKKPLTFVRPPAEGSGEPFGSHNHCPAITWCDNGDLLAIWYSTEREQSSDLTMLAARLRAGASEWDPAAEFFKSARRNMHGDSLFRDQAGKLFHFNGMGMEGAPRWNKLALLLRTSMDQGVTWSEARPISSGATYQLRHMPIAGGFETKNGWLIQLCDGTEGGEGPSAMHISRDGGLTWNDAGGDIRGIHASVVGLTDGRLMAFGRGQAIDGKMPVSISRDMGKTWTYKASPFPPIGGGQRLTLIRLREGPIMLVSFTSGNRKNPAGMDFTDDKGNTFSGTGMFAALSFDEGETWPVRKLLTPGEGEWDGGAWTGNFTASPTRAEHAGYLAATQTPDNMIHLISSRLHYRFNLAWIQAHVSAPGTEDGLLPANAQRMPELKRNPITNGAEWKNDKPVALPNAKRPKVESVLIYRPNTEWTYSHHQSITFFKGRFYAIWSNGRQDEDAPGQRVLMATSADFKNWTRPRPLVDSVKDEKGVERVLTAAGFHQHDGTLVAYFGNYGPKKETTHLQAVTTTDGERWSAVREMGVPVNPNHGPQRTASGRLIIAGNISFPYTDDPTGLTGWRMTGIYPKDMAATIKDDPVSFHEVARHQGWSADLCEGSIFQTDDGVLHMPLRNTAKGNSSRLWFTQSHDNGATWSAPIETEFSDTNAKFHFGRLPDGRFYYIGNPVGSDRTPLVLSLSRDGARFDRHFILGDTYYERRRPGRAKGGQYGYPHSIIHDGHLYVIVSRRKEAVEVMRVALAELKQEPR